MRAYKFTGAGAVGPFSGVAWPVPNGGSGAWVEAAGDELCRTAVHACRVEDLPWWIDEELWEVELDGVGSPGRHKLTARRGRLVQRVEGWNVDAAREFAEACAWRALARAVEAGEDPGECSTLADLSALDRELGQLVAIAADTALAALGGAAAPAAFLATEAAGRVGGEAAMDFERGRQIAWFRGRLGLAP